MQKITQFLRTSWFNILVIISIIFLIIYLSKIDYLAFDKISIDYSFFIFSIITLWLGFMLSGYSWFFAIKKHNMQISPEYGIISHGLSVFGKYIPGKVWVILGRAGKVSKRYRMSNKLLAIISLKEQLLFLLIGLILSIIPMIFSGFRLEVIIACILGIIFISLMLFSQKIHSYFNDLYYKLFKKHFHLPIISFKDALAMSGPILAYWITWIISFYALCESVQFGNSLAVGFAFPLSICIGLIAFFVPGGIGVREGIMISFLVACGWDITLATTFSILSRLCFVSGEIFIFSLAFLLNLNPKWIKSNKKKKSN